MNPNNRRDKDNNNNNGTAKAITAMPMAWIILVAAALLLLGLSLTMTYHPALAQQNMTEVEGNATIGATGEVSQSEVMFHLEGVRKALENSDVLGAMRYLDVAMNLLRGNSSSSFQGNVTSSTTG